MSSTLDTALAAQEARTPDALALLEALVATNSHTRHPYGCDANAQLLTAALHGLPLGLSRHAAAGYGDHLVFSTPRARLEPAMLLIGHHDTVFPQGTFEGYRRAQGLAFGPGVLDMKGGLVVIVSALQALHAAGVLDQLPISFVCVSDEEVGSPSSQSLIAELAQSARLGLVFEAGRAGDAIITSRRGAGHATLVARGRAAHAGNARADGASAILALARAIDGVERLNEQLSGASASVGIVRGGSARNTVPAEAEAEVDLRFTTASVQHALIAALDEVALTAAASVRDTHVAVKVHVSRAPWSETPETLALAERYGACQRASGLGSGIAPTPGGGSDGNTLAAAGVAVIDGLGPRGSGFHTHEERMELNSLSTKAAALVRFLLGELATSVDR